MVVARPLPSAEPATRERRASSERRRLVTELPPALERRSGRDRRVEAVRKADRRVFFDRAQSDAGSARAQGWNSRSDRKGRLIDIYV